MNREVVIESMNHTRAQQACDLIIASLNLIQGTANVNVRDLIIYARDKDNTEKISKWLPVNNILESSMQYLMIPRDIPIACRVATKASYRKYLVNSLIKYHLSNQIYSTHIMDLSPYNIIERSPFPYDYIRFGYAIFIAYSIIEELKLEVRATKENPSYINKEWNPVVKDDLEERLKRAKINAKEPLLWQLRGRKTSLEKRKEIEISNMANWSSGEIRDCEVSIIDAISYLSWLRSKIVAHRLDKDVVSLSVYDVGNAQHLARRLILEHLGFWSYLKTCD